MTEKKTHKTTDSARKNTNPAELAPSTILSMVGEGGGYTIEGHQRKGQWQFRLVISSASHLVNEEDDPGTQAVRRESALPVAHTDVLLGRVRDQVAPHPQTLAFAGRDLVADAFARVFGKDVVVVADKHDRYGRLVGKVMVADPSCRARSCPKTLDAGLAQITGGMAWWYRQYAREQPVKDARAYEFAEKEARARHAGLWRDTEPMAPWDWRHASRP